LKPRKGWLLAAATIASLVGGCSAFSKTRPNMDAEAGLYDKAAVVYRLDASRLCEPVALSHIEGQAVTYEQQAPAPVPESSVGTLKVRYPHPDGRAGYAQAEVTISTRVPLDEKQLAAITTNKKTGWSAWFQPKKPPTSAELPEIGHETWTCDVPKSDLDRALGQLNEGGFFTVAAPPDVGVMVEAEIDGARRIKAWRQVPEFDALMIRTRKHGQLVAYQRDPKAVQKAMLALRQMPPTATTPAAPATKTAAAAPLVATSPVLSGPTGLSAPSLLAAPPTTPAGLDAPSVAQLPGDDSLQR
jgi:hypothetical protein